MKSGSGPPPPDTGHGGFLAGDLAESLLVNSPYFGNFPVNSPQPPVDGGENWKSIINSCRRPER